jgi:hypothetical protein
METVLTIATITSPIVVALITGWYSVKQSKVQKQIEVRQEEADRKAELRRKESLLSMKMASANTRLTIGVAMALKRGHANGEIEDGMKAVEDAEREYNNFLKSVAINDITI